MHFGDRRSALVVTKWLDFGHGDTPLNPKWRRHLYQSYIGALTMTEADREHGVRSGFERDVDKSRGTLTEQNAAMLRDGLFRESLRRWGDNHTWSSQDNISLFAGRVASRADRATGCIVVSVVLSLAVLFLIVTTLLRHTTR